MILNLLLSILVYSAEYSVAPVEIISEAPQFDLAKRLNFTNYSQKNSDLLTADAKAITEDLRGEPGVSATSEGSPLISIRGSSQLDRILQIFNGVPLNHADGLGASDLLIADETLGSIQFVKSSASAAFGRSAVGGVLLRNSRWFDTNTLRVSTRDDSGSIGGRSLFFAIPFQKKNAHLTAFFDHDPGKFNFSRSGRVQTRENNFNSTQRFTQLSEWKVNKWRLKPQIIYTKKQGITPGAIDNPYLNRFDRNAQLYSFEFEKIEAANNFSGVLFSTFLRSDDTVEGQSALPSYTSAKTGSMLSYFHDFKDIKSTFLMDTFLDRVGSFSRTTTEPGLLLEFNALNFNFVTSQRFIPYESKLINAITIRKDYIHHSIWNTIAEGFRTPSLSDLYDQTPYFVGNTDLKSEKSLTFEIGIESKFGQKFANYFEGFINRFVYYEINYQQLFDVEYISAIQARKINRQKSLARGFELQTGYSFRVWSIQFGYNYLATENKDNGQRLRLSPEHQANLLISQQMGPVVFEINEKFQSSIIDFRYPSNEPVEIGGWFITDINIRTLGLSQQEYKFGITNLFDRGREFNLSYPERQRQLYAAYTKYW